MTQAGNAAPLSRRESAKEERRARILDAVRELIRETGQPDLSVRALAERAGVSVATTYNLFGSKRAMVLAALEDERDFVERFAKLESEDPIARIFAAHELAFGYYTNDPGLYRALWGYLLDNSADDSTGLASPERRERTRAIWMRLLEEAHEDGYLSDALPLSEVLRSLAHITGGALLSWVTGGIATSELTASVGLGYALTLKAVATGGTVGSINPYIAGYRDQLAARNDGGSTHLTEVL